MCHRALFPNVHTAAANTAHKDRFSTSARTLGSERVDVNGELDARELVEARVARLERADDRRVHAGQALLRERLVREPVVASRELEGEVGSKIRKLPKEG